MLVGGIAAVDRLPQVGGVADRRNVCLALAGLLGKNMCEVLYLPGSKNSKCIAIADCFWLCHCNLCGIPMRLCFRVEVWSSIVRGDRLLGSKASFCKKTMPIVTHSWLYTHQKRGFLALSC